MKIVLPNILDQTSITQDWWPSLTPAERNQITAAQTLTLDLQNVEQLDTAGLAWLINVVRDAKSNSINLQMENFPNKLHQLARVSGVDQLFPIKQTKTDEL